MKLLLASTALLLLPIHGTERDATTPHESMVAIVKSLRANDVAGFLHASVGEARYALLSSGWDRNRRAKADPAEDAQFRAVMAMLTAPGAEETLMAQVEPKLAEMRPQVAMLAGMVSGMGQMMMQQQPELSTEEREQAQRLLDAFGKHLMTHDVTSPESARKAIGILCSTARKLGLSSLEDVQTLSLDELLVKLGVALEGLKGVLDVYGVSIDRSLDSFQAETVSVTPDHAVVRVQFEFLGVENSSDVELVKSGSDWLPKAKASPLAALDR